MRTKIYFFTISLLILSFSLLSCSDDDNDTTKPSIVLTSPAEGQVLETGSNIHFEALFEDNEELASYKIDIHNNFDGHGHKSLKEGDETKPFSFNKSWKDIAGKKQAEVNHDEIFIPKDATPGKYHFLVFCLDISGNEFYVARNIIIGHDTEDHDHE
ncbi:MAG: DUF4625 domain-containing protein [Dysgonomonas sp.]